MNAWTRSHDDYTVGWICALPVETAAAKLMLDEIHPPLPRVPMDQNAYIFGSIGEHNVVIASLPTGAYVHQLSINSFKGDGHNHVITPEG